MCARACVCVHMCVHVCVRTCVCVCVYCVCIHVAQSFPLTPRIMCHVKGALLSMQRGGRAHSLVCQMPLTVCRDFSQRKQTGPCPPNHLCQPGLWVWFSGNTVGPWCLPDFHDLAPLLSCHSQGKSWGGLLREKPSPFCVRKEIISRGTSLSPRL